MKHDAERAALRGCFEAALCAVQPAQVLQSYLQVDAWGLRFERGAARAALPWPDRAAGGRLRLLAIGKAAARFAAAFEARVSQIDAGLVVVKAGHVEALATARLVEASHPLPDVSSVAAGNAVLAFAKDSGPLDRHVILLSGGASALAVAPVDGITLADKQRVTELLLRGGASIAELNAVRKHLSALKGGGLAVTIAPAASMTLAISDVEGDDPAVIASGPTRPDPGTYAEASRILQHYAPDAPRAVLAHIERGVEGRVAETPKPGDPRFDTASYAVIATPDDALQAYAEAARGCGFEVEVLGRTFYDDLDRHIEDLLSRIATLRAQRGRGQTPVVVLAAGEPRVRVTGSGRGGRCQEFALRMAQRIDGMADVWAFAAGTDGTDGPTSAAGACVDGDSWQRMRRAGIDPSALLADNDAHAALQASDDLLVTGPTGTNVADLYAVLIR
jgi:glycerate 2-kinase